MKSDLFIRLVAPIPRLAATLLVLFAYPGLAFGSEIHDAIQSCDLMKVKTLLKAQPGLLSGKDDFGREPLSAAVAFGCKDVLEFLFASNADINAKDTHGWTALHWAADSGKRDVAELLVAHGADVNATTTNGPSPEFVGDAGVDAEGHVVIQRRLVNKADSNTEAIAGWTPLHLAAIRGDKEMVSLLLANKANVNAKTANGWTALRWALSAGKKEVAAFLRQRGGRE